MVDPNDLKNWRRAVADGGKTYFYNKVSRETTWEPPFGVTDGGSELLTRKWSPALAEADHKAPPPTSEKQNNPDEGDDNSEDEEDHVEDGNDNSEEEIEDESLTAASFSQIKEAVDPKTGNTYYYDKVSHQVWWIDPRLEFLVQQQQSQQQQRQQQQDEQKMARDQEMRKLLHLEQEEQRLCEQMEEQQYYYSHEDEQEEEESLGFRAADQYPGEYQEEEQFMDLVQDFRNFSTSARDDEYDDEYDDDLESDHSGTRHAENVNFSNYLNNGIYVSNEEDVSLDAVRSSLVLLKKRMVKSSVKRPQTAQPTSSFESGPSAMPLTAAASVPIFPPQMRVDKFASSCTRKSGCRCAVCAEASAVQVDLVAVSDSVRASFANRATAPPAAASSQPPARKKKPSVTGSPKVDSGASKTGSWRNKSQQLRQAMVSQQKHNSANDFLASSPVVVDHDLVLCPHCNRTFNYKAAERHIPKCTQIKAKPTPLKRGSGKGAHISLKLASTAGSASKSMTWSSTGSPGATFSSGGGGGNNTDPSIYSGNGSARRSRPSLHRESLVSHRSVTENGVHLDPCPHCDKKFSRKAFDRHVEYCEQSKAKQDLRMSLDFSTSKARKHQHEARRSTLSTSVSVLETDQAAELWAYSNSASVEDNFEDFYSNNKAGDIAALEADLHTYRQQLNYF